MECSHLSLAFCKMWTTGLMVKGPFKNNCLWACRLFLEVEVDTHTQWAHLLWAKGNFLPAGMGLEVCVCVWGGGRGGASAACFGLASSRRIGVFGFDCSESWPVDCRFPRLTCCDEHCTSKQKHWMRAAVWLHLPFHFLTQCHSCVCHSC